MTPRALAPWTLLVALLTGGVLLWSAGYATTSSLVATGVVSLIFGWIGTTEDGTGSRVWKAFLAVGCACLCLAAVSAWVAHRTAVQSPPVVSLPAGLPDRQLS